MALTKHSADDTLAIVKDLDKFKKNVECTDRTVNQ